jgi:hypothetical protein
MTKKYSLNQAVKIARLLEDKLSYPHNCHFAIGGSTVMNPDGSTKDFDIFVYPRSGRNIPYWSTLITGIQNLGWTLQASNIPETVPVSNWVDASSSPTKPYALFETAKGYRVDLFIMSCFNMKVPGENIEYPYKEDDKDLPF